MNSLCDLVLRDVNSVKTQGVKGHHRNLNSLFLCPCFSCLASWYSVTFVTGFLFFLGVYPSKCLESVCFVMLKLTRRQCRTGGQVKGGGRVTHGWLKQNIQGGSQNKTF